MLASPPLVCMRSDMGLSFWPAGATGMSYGIADEQRVAEFRNGSWQAPPRGSNVLQPLSTQQPELPQQQQQQGQQGPGSDR